MIMIAFRNTITPPLYRILRLNAEDEPESLKVLADEYRDRPFG